MNSVLQCLAHTAPLAEAALQGLFQHNLEDPLGITLAHIRRVFTATHTISPRSYAQNLRVINKRCVHGVHAA